MATMIAILKIYFKPLFLNQKANWLKTSFEVSSWCSNYSPGVKKPDLRGHLSGTQVSDTGPTKPFCLELWLVVGVFNQAVTQRAHDVNITSPQRRCNVMTLRRRYIYVMCPLGTVSTAYKGDTLPTEPQQRWAPKKYILMWNINPGHAEPGYTLPLK